MHFKGQANPGQAKHDMDADMDAFESLMRKKLANMLNQVILTTRPSLTTRTPWTKSLVKMVIKRTEKKVAS